MPRIGIVIGTTGQSARVSAPRRGVCEGCSDRSSCSFENALGQDEPEIVVVHNPISARAGQTVEFDLLGHTELKVSLLVWIVPLIGLIAGAAAGASLHEWFSLSQDPATLLGAVIGCVAAFLPVMLFDRMAAGKTKYVPSILKVIDPSSCPDLPRVTDPPD
jgi:sigma-E factor negative regulatory protein RseC